MNIFKNYCLYNFLVKLFILYSIILEINILKSSKYQFFFEL